MGTWFRGIGRGLVVLLAGISLLLTACAKTMTSSEEQGMMMEKKTMEGEQEMMKEKMMEGEKMMMEEKGMMEKEKAMMKEEKMMEGQQ